MSVIGERHSDQDGDKSDSRDNPNERASEPRSSFDVTNSELQVELVQTVRSTCNLVHEVVEVGQATQLKRRETRAADLREEVSSEQRETNGCDQRANNERAASLSQLQILNAQNLLDDDDDGDNATARAATAAAAGQWPTSAVAPATTSELPFVIVDLKYDENDAFCAHERGESVPESPNRISHQPEDVQLAMIGSNQHGTIGSTNHQQQSSQAHHLTPDRNPNPRTHPNQHVPLPQVGFGQVQPRLSATSKRMRDYIETFRWRRQQRTSYERTRVYQFFKCARTELVASLLFSLIVCYSLISCKTSSYSTSLLKTNLPDHHHHHQQQQQEPLANQQELPTPSRGDLDEVSSDQVHAYLEHAAATTSKLQVHLTTGLVSAFAVATLTQVFGHVSGCHLLPSVSLALYLKGHISRARLVAYLAAQSAGSLLGVGLLALLTSSQVTTVQYHLPSAYNSNGSLGSPAAPDKLMMQNHAHQKLVGRPWGDAASVERRRKRSLDVQLPKFENFTNYNRLTSPGEPQNSGSGDDPLHSPAIPPSESILVSIEEQREHELTARRQRHREQQSVASSAQVRSGSGNDGGDDDDDHGDGSSGDHLRVSARREKISNFNARAQPSLNSSSSSTPIAGGLIASEQVAPAARAKIRANNAPASEGSSNAPVISNKQVVARTVAAAASGQQLVMVPLNSDFGSGAQQAAAAAVRNEGDSSSRTRATALPAADSAHELDPPAPPLKRDDDTAATGAAPPESARRQQPATRHEAVQRKLLKRKKRARRKQRAPGASSGNSSADERSVRTIHVNLLQLALPDAIMTSESVRECLRATAVAVAVANQDRENIQDQSQLAKLSLNQCLGSSNGSQMFIFQLLGTLLVNLAYLVNVDPRRSDLGYKSLSIGLAYFLAHALTVNSGGFYGSPVQLLALASLSATRDSASSVSWHSEWAIYLIVPLIGGLFSAISHEYIDFTSARNCDKTLRLRRSFFSLEDLGDGACGVGATKGGVAADSANPAVTPTSEIGYLDTNNEQLGPRAATRKLITGGENPMQCQRRQKRLSSSVAAVGENSLAATTSSDDGHGSMGANSSLATLHLTDLNNNNNNDQQSTNELKLKSVSSGYLRGNESGQSSQQYGGGGKPDVCSRTASASRASILLDSNFLISCPAAGGARKCQPAAALASTTNRRAHYGRQQPLHHRHQPGQFTCTSQFM